MSPKFFVLVSHGLNLNPNKMKSFCSMLESMGGKTELVELAGHKKGEADAYHNVQKEQWLTDLDIKFQEYLKNYSHLPLYYLGFSLGSLVCTSYLQQNKIFQQKLKKQIFIAPGLAPHKIYSKIYQFMKFPAVKIPSMNLRGHGVHRLSSLAINNQIFGLIEEIRSQSFDVINIPTLVFLNPKDELVSYKRSCEFVIEAKLTNWKIKKIIPHRKKLQFMPQHLVVDEYSMGTSEWRNVEKEIGLFV